MKKGRNGEKMGGGMEKNNYVYSGHYCCFQLTTQTPTDWNAKNKLDIVLY